MNILHNITSIPYILRNAYRRHNKRIQMAKQAKRRALAALDWELFVIMTPADYDGTLSRRDAGTI